MKFQWKCPTCGGTVGTLNDKYPPVCRNAEKHHHNREVEMKKVDK